MDPAINRDAKQSDRSPESKKERQLKEQLEQMNLKLQQRKEREVVGADPMKYVVRIEKPVQRPPTPSIEVPAEEEQEMNIAAHLLQNLIRGRAVQLQMYTGKQRRLQLINEVRARHVIRDLEKPEVGDDDLFSRISDEKSIRFESAVQAEYVGKTLDFLTKELTRLREEKRIAAMVKLAERTRRIREAKESGNFLFFVLLAVFFNRNPTNHHPTQY